MTQKNNIYVLILSTLTCCSNPTTEYKTATLNLRIDTDSQIQLNKKRDVALKHGILFSSKKDFVKAKIQTDTTIAKVKIRLKGDWTDHIKGKHWSFRVRSKKPILGMKRFNLHYPSAKSYSRQWLFYEACKKEGLITPKVDYIYLVLNTDTSVYQIEEHMDFRLLENHNLLKGPILKFDESTPWQQTSKGIKWTDEIDSLYFMEAPIDAFRTKAILADSSLNVLFLKGVKKLKQFRSNQASASETFDVSKLARYFALTDLFGASHARRWHNMRFYFNPKTELLEPIVFDDLIGGIYDKFCQSYSEQALNRPFMRLLFNDDAFSAEFDEKFKKFTSRKYVDDLIETSEDLHDEILQLLKSEFPAYEFSSKFLERNSKRASKQ